MKNGAGLLRVGAVVVAVAAVCVGAVRVPGSVQLADARDRAGVPASSTVLVDSATLVCPGPQRIGAKGLRDVTGAAVVSAASPPAQVLASVSAATAATAASASATGSVSLSIGGQKPVKTVRERGSPPPQRPRRRSRCSRSATRLSLLGSQPPRSGSGAATTTVACR